MVSPEALTILAEALHVYKLNADVDEHNGRMLRRIPSTVTRFAVKASDAATGQTTFSFLSLQTHYEHIDWFEQCMISVALNPSDTETGGLHGVFNTPLSHW